MDVSTVYSLVPIVALAIALLHRYFIHYHSYWQTKGIPCAKNRRPIIGHVSPINIFKSETAELVAKIYKNHPTSSMVGFYNYRIPCLIVRDPELVNKVLIAKFDHFSDNNMIIQEHEEPLLAKNPFFTNGAAWKTGRTRLTSSLTGYKLKTYLPMIRNITEMLVNYVDRHIRRTGSYEVEAKGLFTRVTAEVAATVGFGIEGHCFDDSKGTDNFTAVGRLFFASDLKTMTKAFLLQQFPWLLGLLKVPFFSKDFEDFFERLIKLTLDSRRTATKSCKNLIDSIIDQEEKEGDLETRFRDISSHMLSFLVNIFKTTSVTMTFLAYNLCVNKDVQNKLRDEITKVMDKYRELNYEAVNEMVRLERAISESLRLFPVITFQIKRCTQATELEGFDGLKCVVEPGTRIYIPVGGLHRDTQFWDEPDAFKPERFSEEKIAERSRSVYLPFGEGPRMCPGSKIATLVVKMTFAAMLTKFEFNLSEKTKLPLTFDRSAFLPNVVGGMWLNIKKLN